MFLEVLFVVQFLVPSSCELLETITAQLQILFNRILCWVKQGVGTDTTWKGLFQQRFASTISIWGCHNVETFCHNHWATLRWLLIGSAFRCSGRMEKRSWWPKQPFDDSRISAQNDLCCCSVCVLCQNAGSLSGGWPDSLFSCRSTYYNLGQG